ncbi:protoporphyrinogen oxidase [Sediminivirga luteola]|nr:protoporphyrinogen oxidase [Sediminivirga luteola]MCI2266203.1 protoporphyrinogen oxidase [Sediminivirga luteola]
MAVIGGGISGLTAARDLLGQGAGVHLFEAGPRFGGLIRGTTLGGVLPVSADTGAEASLFRRPETAALCRELGLDLQHPDPSQQARILSRGGFHPVPGGVMGIPGDPDQLAGLLDESEVERVRDERIVPVHEDLTVGEFLAGRFGVALVDRVVDPLLGGVYAGSAWDLSLQQTVPAFWEAARTGRSLIALAAAASSPGEGTAGTDGGSSAHRRTPVFMGLRGGMSRLVAALEEDLRHRGAQLHPDAPVTALERAGEGWTLRTPAGPVPGSFDGVILALPAWAAAPLLRPHARDAAAALDRLEWSSQAVVTVLLEVSTPAGLPEGSGFLIPALETRVIKAATHSCRKWPWLAQALPPSTALVRMSIGRHRDERLLGLDDDELMRRALEDYRRLTGTTAGVLASEVTRWQRSLPQYAPGHAGLVARAERALRAAPGLALAGSSYDGVGIPACIGRAHRAASALAGEPADRPAGP